MSSQKRGRRIKLPLIAALVLLILLSAVNVKIVGGTFNSTGAA